MIPFIGMSTKPNTLTPEEGEGGGGVDEPHTEDANAATTYQITSALEVLSMEDVASGILMQIEAGRYQSACEQAANWETTCKLVHKGCDNQYTWLTMIKRVFGKDAPIPPNDRNISNRNWFFVLCNRHHNLDITTKRLADLRTRIASLKKRNLNKKLNLDRKHRVALQDKVELLNFSELFESKDKEAIDPTVDASEAQANEAKLLQVESTLERLYKEYDSYDRSMNRLFTLYNLGVDEAELFIWQTLLVHNFDPIRPAAINFYREFDKPSPPKNDSETDSETESESDSFKRVHAHHENLAKQRGVHVPTRKELALVKFEKDMKHRRWERGAEQRKLLLQQQGELAQKMLRDAQQQQREAEQRQLLLQQQSELAQKMMLDAQQRLEETMKNLPPGLLQQIQSGVAAVLEGGGGESAEEVMKKLPPGLLQEIESGVAAAGAAAAREV
jgi:hypothetical protein